MKKQLIAVAGLAVLSTPAFASKARMTALGQDTGGSNYISDQRKTFKNPAYYNKYNNFVITELGTDDGTTNAEGGFARQSGNFVYGAYLGNDVGRDDATSGSIGNISAVTAGDTFLDIDQSLDLSFAGDAGIKWGATLSYGSAEDQDDNATANDVLTSDADYTALKAGVMGSNWEAYAHFTLKDEANGMTDSTASNRFGPDAEENEKDTYEKDNITLGGNYGHGDWTFFFKYSTSEVTVHDEAVSSDKDGLSEQTTMELGAAHMMKLDDKATMWTALTYSSDEDENKDVGSDDTLENNSSGLELLVAMEAKANSWLTLRGSIKQNVIISDTENPGTATEDKFEDSGTDTTEVAAGASLTYGKLMIDGTLAGESNGNLTLDTLLSEVAIHYWF